MQEEIHLSDIFNAVWSEKSTLAIVTIVFGLLGYLAGQLLPDQYRAQALVSPVDDKDSGMMPFQQEFGQGITALAGLSLNRLPQDDSALAIELLRSRSFLSRFIDKHDLAPQLLAVDHWNNETKELVIDSSIYDSARAQWRTTSDQFPTEERLFIALRDRIEVVREAKTGFITIAVTHESPMIAKWWVDWLIEDVNDRVRSKDIEESEEAISFLRIQASKNSFADLDQVFYELIQSQMQRMMLANVRSDYVFDTVDPAFSPEKPFSPNRFLISLLGFVVGVILAIAIVLSKKLIQGKQTLE